MCVTKSIELPKSKLTRKQVLTKEYKNIETEEYGKVDAFVGTVTIHLLLHAAYTKRVSGIVIKI